MMVEAYNRSVGSHTPKLHSLVGDMYRGPPGMRHTEWALHHDPTYETERAPCKFLESSLGGLPQFFNTNLVNDPGMNDKTYLNLLFQGHEPDERASPIPVKLESLSKEKEKLRKKIEADEKSNPMQDKINDALRGGVI